MVATLSPYESKLLVRLRKEQALKGNPQAVYCSGAKDWKYARAAGRALVERGFAKGTRDSEAPGMPLLWLTPSGVSAADQIIMESTFLWRVKQINWRGWLGLFVAIAAVYFAYTGPHK